MREVESVLDSVGWVVAQDVEDDVEGRWHWDLEGLGAWDSWLVWEVASDQAVSNSVDVDKERSSGDSVGEDVGIEGEGHAHLDGGQQQRNYSDKRKQSVRNHTPQRTNADPIDSNSNTP